ncbi:MAG: GatB/YqeY domain-containing protein [Candidatus Protistobacter heckmanni]|nr:GatB/YqeY domain-containing protein [Candidatus Protistobacter heckmanni]MCS6764862.1 GatB/YqeY domain-containing protein [Candidatus Protistobacter heckmanni]
MNLKQRINDDMKAAMRAREAERLGSIRMLLAAMKQCEVDERIELDDAAIFALVEKLIKQRRDASSQFKQAGREDLVAKEEAEIVVLAAYMPAQMSAEEVAAAIAKAGAKGPQDMGKVMGVLKPALAGCADMGAASGQLKTALAALA